jgi:carboxypeptidase Taq
MEKYLGIRPSNYAEGCLQDIHWAMGGFGYFPTYTLGNLYAAHLFEAFVKDHPNWNQRVELGELDFIRLWLHEKIYKHGRRYSSAELLKQATNTPFSAKAYLDYLKHKYETIYS